MKITLRVGIPEDPPIPTRDGWEYCAEALRITVGRLRGIGMPVRDILAVTSDALGLLDIVHLAEPLEWQMIPNGPLQNCDAVPDVLMPEHGCRKCGAAWGSMEGLGLHRELLSAVLLRCTEGHLTIASYSRSLLQLTQVPVVMPETVQRYFEGTSELP